VQILKFGGSSLADAIAIRHVAKLIGECARDTETVVVCSACAGVTNRLVRITELVRAGQSIRALNQSWKLRLKHRALYAALGPENSNPEAGARMDADSQIWTQLEDLGASLRALIAGASPEQADQAWTAAVLSYGERASVRLVAHALQHAGVRAQAADATNFLITDNEFQNATPLWNETRQRTREVLFPMIDAEIVPVVTGFIGATPSGKITTLGRNSSDFTAAIVASALDADEVSLWTDVDGIYDRDPRAAKQSPEEFVLLENLTYDEALHLAERGAKVLHPGTIYPLREKNIVLRIRNTFHPEHSGTRIGPAAQAVAR
jgi:aspartate kinase